MMKNRKWISKLSAVLLAVLLIVSTAVTAFASGIPAAPNPDDGPGSLTVHKYATFSTSSTPGTGLELPSDVADKLGSVLPGAKFALYRIEETWSETNPTGYRVTAATQAELD
ncbi:hypothetical protein LJC64_02785, partial [Ruminococcaceae bacterium OttesenSCG-928-A11]|nr:hypothetical protein [Ruminococcaceae bacterium OttesenSCG-928-A11]